ncbi:MAG: ATPase [Epulopiscium sp. Nele67-Bin004]|nr:MAG: ATPase [Epulopiscium sp. Nele67-Bin004]
MILTAIIAAVIATITIEFGIRAVKTNKQGNIRSAILSSIVPFVLVVVAMATFMFIDNPILASGETAAVVAEISIGEGLKYLAAALSTGLATIGTGRAVGAVASAAIGAVSEDPSILGKTLIFVGMAEGIAIYGMIISILILFG